MKTSLLRARVSRAGALVLPLTLLACGGHSTPSAPTSTPNPSAALFNVVPGSYGLTLTMAASGDPVCTGGFCRSISFCSGTASPVSTFSTVVRLDRSGDAVTIRSEDASATLRIELRLSGSAAAGTVSGQFRDGAHQVAIVSVNAPGAAMTGTVLAAAVAGRIEGEIGADGYSCSNNGHTWTLTPR